MYARSLKNRRHSMEYVFGNGLSIEEYDFLRDDAGWEHLNSEQSLLGLKGSAFIASCHDGKGDIAGMARIIWDGGHIAYLADVIVRHDLRGSGIGKRLVGMCCDFVRSCLKDDWKIKIVLVAAKGRETFYEQFGFIARPNERSGAGMEIWIGPENEE